MFAEISSWSVFEPWRVVLKRVSKFSHWNSTDTTSGDLKLGRIIPNTTQFDATGGSISTNEF